MDQASTNPRVGQPIRLAVALAVAMTTVSTSHAQEFRRGDADGDGFAGTVMDVLVIDAYTGEPICGDAADVNDDGQYDLLDVVNLYEYAIGFGPVAAPGPDNCGPDPTDDPFDDCTNYTACGPPVDPAPDNLTALDLTTDTVQAGEIATVTVLFDNVSSEPCRGVSFGVCHDPSQLAVTAVTLGATFNNALPLVTGGPWEPSFWQAAIYPDGWTAYAVIGLTPGPFLPVGLDYELFDVQYQTLEVGDAELTFCESLGSPVVRVRAALSNAQIPVIASRPTTTDGAITAIPPTPFRRGDANLDSVVDIADAVALLLRLFSLGTPSPHDCEDATDANDDGQFDIADPVDLLVALFGGSSLAAPGLSCGFDPTPDQLVPCTDGACP